MPNRRRGKRRTRKDGTLGMNKRCNGISPSLRVDETMRHGLSTFDGVDETVAHGLSPGEKRLDETGAVASSSSAVSELNMIVGCTNNKVVANKSGADISPSLRVDDTVRGLSPCVRRLDETVPVASSSSSLSELKLIVGCGRFFLLYLIVCYRVLFCLFK